MIRKGVLRRLLFWAAVAVAHFVASEWVAHVFREVAFEWKVAWLYDAVYFLLFAPGGLLAELGFGPKRWKVRDALAWTALVAGIVIGTRWLWAIRPGRRRP